MRRNGVRLAGLCKTSPAIVKQSVDEHNKNRCAPMLVSSNSPMSRKTLTSKTRFALVLGADALFDCQETLTNKRIQLFLLVVDCEYALREAGIPVLDSDESISQEHVRSWLSGKGAGLDIESVKFDSLIPKTHIMEKLEHNDRSVARMMLELTMPVSSKKSKSMIRKCFLRWLSSPRKTKDDLAVDLSPHVDVADVEKALNIIGSDDFTVIKRKCERLAALLRKTSQEVDLEKWITRNAVSSVKSPRDLPAFDVRYLVSVWRETS